MNPGMFSRRLIALLAAYAVALQMLLLPLTAFAAPEPGLCAAAEGTHQPAGHDTGCPCTAGCLAQCCSTVLASPPGDGDIQAYRADVAIVAPALTATAIPLLASYGPHNPRAPPTA